MRMCAVCTPGTCASPVWEQLPTCGLLALNRHVTSVFCVSQFAARKGNADIAARFPPPVEGPVLAADSPRPDREAVIFARYHAEPVR